jgi:tetratricopeptide (TPR) repeat protein
LDASHSYQEAISVYDKALTFAPDDVKVLSNKGNTLAKLGDLQTHMGWNSEALHSYQNALTAYAQALTQAPGSIQIPQQ